MAFDVRDTLIAIQSHVAKSGHARETIVGEPKSPPSDATIVASIFLESLDVVGTTLDGSVELYTVTVRFYQRLFEEPTDGLEYSMAQALSAVTASLMGDFTLGGRIRQIDVGGIFGSTMRTRWGYSELGRIMFRTADLLLPLVVDDSATLAA